MRALLVLAASTAVLLVADEALARRHPACRSGRFVVRGSGLLGGGAPTPTVLVLGGGKLVVEGACIPVQARFSRGPAGTVVRARLRESCAGLYGRVTLRARLDRRCAKLRGVLRVPGRAGGRRFVAHAAPCQPTATGACVPGCACPSETLTAAALAGTYDGQIGEVPVLGVVRAGAARDVDIELRVDALDGYDFTGRVEAGGTLVLSGALIAGGDGVVRAGGIVVATTIDGEQRLSGTLTVRYGYQFEQRPFTMVRPAAGTPARFDGAYRLTLLTVPPTAALSGCFGLRVRPDGNGTVAWMPLPGATLAFGKGDVLVSPAGRIAMRFYDGDPAITLTGRLPDAASVGIGDYSAGSLESHAQGCWVVGPGCDEPAPVPEAHRLQTRSQTEYCERFVRQYLH